MKKKTLRKLYYIAWAVGLIAACALIYGIITSIFINIVSILIRGKI